VSLIPAFYQSCVKGKETGKGKGSQSRKMKGKGSEDLCNDKSGKKSSDGGGLCKSEPTIDTRIYDITIVATDKAGNKGVVTCSIIVIPEDHYGDAEDCISPDALRDVYANSKQRYKLSQSSSTWDKTQSSGGGSKVPPPEQVEESCGNGLFIPGICQEKTSNGKSGKRGKNQKSMFRERKMRNASGHHD
jgi:hypothetical protein